MGGFVRSAQFARFSPSKMSEAAANGSGENIDKNKLFPFHF